MLIIDQNMNQKPTEATVLKQEYFIWGIWLQEQYLNTDHPYIYIYLPFHISAAYFHRRKTIDNNVFIQWFASHSTLSIYQYVTVWLYWTGSLKNAFFYWTGVYDTVGINCYSCNLSSSCNDPFDTFNNKRMIVRSSDGWCWVSDDRKCSKQYSLYIILCLAK
jgi:hypothetical protein